MENTNIILEFKPMATFVSGRSFGKEIYKTQIKNSIANFEEMDIIKIEFPPKITYISISFIKGLMNDYIEKYGANNVYDKVIFITSDEELSKKVREDIIF